MPPLTGQSATSPTAEHPLKANSTMTESSQSWICVINGLVSLGPLYSQRRRRPLRGVPSCTPSQQSQVASICCRHHRYLQSPSSIDHQPEPSLECSASTHAQSFNKRRSWKMRGLQDVPSPCISPRLMRPKRWPHATQWVRPRSCLMAMLNALTMRARSSGLVPGWLPRACATNRSSCSTNRSSCSLWRRA